MSRVLALHATSEQDNALIHKYYVITIPLDQGHLTNMRPLSLSNISGKFCSPDLQATWDRDYTGDPNKTRMDQYRSIGDSDMHKKQCQNPKSCGR